MYSLITNDVEEISIVKHRMDSDTARLVSEKALPKLIDLFSKYDVKSTFYFTGTFAEAFPKSVELVHNNGHEVGCHGYSHKVQHSFDVLSIKQQYTHLSKAKNILEQNIGKVTSFRAPALRINNTMPLVLEALNFETDSSVCPQRFEGPLTFGWKNKLNWLLCSRSPYYMSKVNPFKSGNSKVLEIPVSSAIFAYQGSTMRIAPQLFEVLENLMISESKKSDRPLNFLFHPIEIIDEKYNGPIVSRGSNVIEKVFGDKLRRNLKIKNLGANAFEGLSKSLKKIRDNGFEFLTVQEYANKWRKFKNE